MIEKTLLVVLFLFVLNGCSSNQMSHPPKPHFIKELKEKQVNNSEVSSDDLGEQQAITFLQGQGQLKNHNYQAACNSFSLLGNDLKFPLRQLALINTINICPYTTLQVRQLWEKELKEVNPAWKKDFLEASLLFSKSNGLDSHYIDYSLALTSYLKTRKEKESYLKKLLKETNKNILVAEALYKLSPRLNPTPKKENLPKVAYDFSLNRNFVRARRLFSKIIGDSSFTPQERLQAFKRKAFSFKLERDKTRYSWQLEKAVEWFKKNPSWMKDTVLSKKFFQLKIQTARAQWTVNYRRRAEKTLNQLIDNPKAPSSIKATAFFILGKIEVEKKDLKLAQIYYNRGISQEDIDEGTLELLVWSLGWSHYLNKDYKKALNVFLTNKERTLDQAFQRKLKFWIAKIHEKMNKVVIAKTLFDELTEDDPFGFYGISSAMILNKELKLNNHPSYEYEIGVYPKLDWLIALEKFDHAKEFLKSIQAKYASAQEIAQILPYYHFSRWYEGGIFKFFKVKGDEREEIEKEYLSSAYPLPYKETILSQNNTSKVPAAFVYSIARQESAFNPTVRSWADAFGLLQVTPEKAKKLARRLKLKYNDYNDLYIVDTNISIGSELLRQLASRYKGLFIPTVAAYNAGDTPVKRWLKESRHKDPFEFIEMIPYKETRNYVKLVLRNFSTYSRLLNGQWKQSEDFFSQNVLTQSEMM